MGDGALVLERDGEAYRVERFILTGGVLNSVMMTQLISKTAALVLATLVALASTLNIGLEKAINVARHALAQR